MPQWERRRTEEITAILTWRNMLCLSTMTAFLSCLFSETWARNNSQVYLFSSVPWVVAVFSFQQGLLSFLLYLCHIKPTLLEVFSISSGNDAESSAKWAGFVSVTTGMVYVLLMPHDLFWEPVCFQVWVSLVFSA